MYINGYGVSINCGNTYSHSWIQMYIINVQQFHYSQFFIDEMQQCVIQPIPDLAQLYKYKL